MARESELWHRMKGGRQELAARGIAIDLYRLENAVGVGHPDVEGCIEGAQVWIELKSASRPARPATPIRPKSNPKTRLAQSIWHNKRVAAGCRCNWILLQVGEGRAASLYLIPGIFYDKLGAATEAELALISFNEPGGPLADVLAKAALGW